MENLTNHRILDFRNKLRNNKIDSFLVLNEANRRYLSGYTGQDTGAEESAGALFISQNTLVLLTDSRFELQAASEAPDYDVRCYKTGLQEIIPEILKNTGSKKLGFESSRLSYSTYCKIKECINSNNIKTEFLPADFLVEDMRVIKSDMEIECIRKSLAIAEKAYIQTLEVLKPGISEKDIAWELEKQMRQGGAEGLSFPPIVAAGPNSALPHAIPGDRIIQKNEPLLFDWGAIRDGYCSDTSRTVVIGKPDDTFNKLYAILLDAQQMAIDAIRPGVSTKVIDNLARGHIAKNGYEKQFSHGLGHGVGLEIHEAPRLSPLKESILEKGMIVTVEPGIYLSGWGGIRLENMVLVTENGAEVLNKLTYDHYILGD